MSALSFDRWRLRLLPLAACLLLGWAQPLLAAPGLCIGPVCADEITRSAKHHFQLRMRFSDQQGHRERLTVDCRTGALSPAAGLVERGHARAVAAKACRLAGEAQA